MAPEENAKEEEGVAVALLGTSAALFWDSEPDVWGGGLDSV